MGSPEMGMGSPEQETHKVEIKYTKPGYYNDGVGSLEISIGSEKVTIEFNNKYFEKEDLDKIKTMIEDANNKEKRDDVIEKINNALKETDFRQKVEISEASETPDNEKI